MSESALEARCREAAPAMLELMSAGILVTREPENADRLRAAVSAMQAVVDQGVEGITDEGYLRWHSNAGEALSGMRESIAKGDFVKSWKLFLDTEVGISPLGTVCAGQPSW
ncbi:hypothetical protein [Humidisolicoccus flavus]|uniref:hypothetical protein n=1 Tax=Humidisolicoccus flavus TaxID=3111414 RepID=UPI00324FD9F2